MEAKLPEEKKKGGALRRWCARLDALTASQTRNGATSVAMARPEASPHEAGAPSVECREQVGGTIFYLPKHFEALRPLGKGTYGAVAAFRDVNTGQAQT